MAAFYICSDCNKEFLGADNIPVWEGDHVEPICYRCQQVYNVCIACDALFLPDWHKGDPTGDLCTSCWRSNLSARAALLTDIIGS